MPASTKTAKIEKYLCCTIKSKVKCEWCDRKTCSEHIVFCQNCGDICIRCATAEKCSLEDCRVDICSKCTRIGADGKIKCDVCFDIHDNDGHRFGALLEDD